jgi:hypothetical protein
LITFIQKEKNLSSAMKKIILFPKTDTVILCLPEQWVGVPVVCKLTPMPEYQINISEVETEAERVARFFYKKKRRKNK